MKRRTLIKGALGAATVTACGKLPALSAADQSGRWLGHLYCSGGPDFRQLLAPGLSSDYGQQYWQHRFPAWGLDSMTRVESFMESLHPVETTQGLGMFHPMADWLASQWKKGNVAFVNNVIGSADRNHESATVAMEVGRSGARGLERRGSGWGGRWATAMDENIVSLTPRVRQVCYGPSDHPEDHDNAGVISIRNMRQFGLYRPDTLDERPDHGGYREKMYRALHGYYSALSASGNIEHSYAPLVHHFEKLKDQGALIRQRLEEQDPDPALSALESGDELCYHRGFARQCLNLTDAARCGDILNARLYSLEYGGWDTHQGQGERLSSRFYDLFNAKGCIARTTAAIERDFPEKAKGLVWMISGEFGRQLSANGDGGTDHGRGNAVLLIGPSVRGGLYGELFPDSEMDLFEKRGSDIAGKTSIEKLLSRICDGLELGSSTGIFPTSTDAIEEEGANLDQLFSV